MLACELQWQQIKMSNLQQSFYLSSVTRVFFFFFFFFFYLLNCIRFIFGGFFFLNTLQLYNIKGK